VVKATIRRGGENSRAGFSLLELTTALFILVVGIFGVFHLFFFGLDRMRTIDEAAIATQAVQNELEVLRTTPFSLLQDGARAFTSPNPALDQLHLADTKVTVSPTPDGTIGLKKIEISIRWITENGRRAERSITTLAGEKGS
jgi:Tfp pilus assembly protein PilV